MHKITECVILISLLAADGLAKARAADDAKGVVDPMERQTILLAEFDNVQRGDGSAGRIQRPVLYTIKVRGRVTRILNDAGHQGLREGEFQMEFTESSGGMHKRGFLDGLRHTSGPTIPDFFGPEAQAGRHG